MQNATGQPAIQLPLNTNKAGLPIGVQFVARYGGEMTLLKLAAELEKAAPWADRPAVRHRRLLPAWCRWRMAAMDWGRSASRPRNADCSA
jgi:hypothetical protein